jgi:hypothetical protein
MCLTQDMTAGKALAELKDRIDGAEAQAAVAQQEREAARIAAQLLESSELRGEAGKAIGRGELDAAAALLQRAATACAEASGGGDKGHEGAATACAAEVELMKGTITATRAANTAAEEALQRDAMLQAAAEAEAERQAKEKEALEQAAAARKLQEQAAAAAAAAAATAKDEEAAKLAAAAKSNVKVPEPGMSESSDKKDKLDNQTAPLDTPPTAVTAAPKEENSNQGAAPDTAAGVTHHSASAEATIVGASEPLPQTPDRAAVSASAPQLVDEKASLVTAAAAQEAAAAQDRAGSEHEQVSGTYTSSETPQAAPAMQTIGGKAGDNESAAQSTNVCVAGSGAACLAQDKANIAHPVPAATTAPAVGVGMGVKPVYIEDSGERRQVGLEVSRLVDGGAAAGSGRIHVGDALETVDGVDVRSLPVRQLSAVLAGLEGTAVRLGLRGQAEGATSYEVELVRAAVTAR